MSRSSKICITMVATVLVTVGLLRACAWLFIAPCSSGYPYWLMVSVYPFVALLGAFEIVTPGLALFLAIAQYPAYGFFLGRAWVTRRPLAAIILPAVHILAAVIAAIRWRDNL